MSENGGFRSRIQNASQLKKNVAPCPIQSFRLYSEMSTFRRGRSHLRRNIIPSPAKNATTATCAIVRPQLRSAAGNVQRTMMIVALAARISFFMNSTSSNAGGRHSEALSFFDTGLATGAGLLLFVQVRCEGPRPQRAVLDVELLDCLHHHPEEEPGHEAARDAGKDPGRVRALVMRHRRKQLGEPVDADWQKADEDHKECELLNADLLRPPSNAQRESVRDPLARALRGVRHHRPEQADGAKDVEARHAGIDRHLVPIDPNGAVTQLVALRLADRVDHLREPVEGGALV